MRAIYSYGIALVIVLGLAIWLATGVLVTGGKGPGNGEKPIVGLIDGGNGPLSDVVDNSGINAHESVEGEAEVDPHLTIAERSAETGGSETPPRSVRIETISAQAMPIEVPLRGRTKAKSKVAVVAQTSGIVQAVSVTKGQKVKAGDLLCTLDQGARKLAVDQAQASVDQAQAAFDSNKSLRDKGLAPANSGLAVEAALKGAQAQLENATLELARTEIKTEVAGIIQDPLASVGSMLAAGQPCASVVELDPIVFAASVPEARIAYAKLGLPATVTTVTGQTVEGKVTYIASTADEATRSFPVEIEVPNPDGAILDGITADAIVNVGTSTVHVLKQSVLTLDDEGVIGVRTVENGNKVAFHAVTIVKDTRDGVWVVGLPFKVNVITVGQEFVQPGQIVDARTADGEQAS